MKRHFTAIRMSCLIQGLILSSFILWTPEPLSLPFFLFQNDNLPLPSVTSFFHFCSQYLCSRLSPWHPSYLLILLLFHLISAALSLFLAGQGFNCLGLWNVLFVCICVYTLPICYCVWCGDRSNIVVAILQKNPWGYHRKGRVCFIWWSVFLFFSNLHCTLGLCILLCCDNWIHAFM